MVPAQLKRAVNSQPALRRAIGRVIPRYAPIPLRTTHEGDLFGKLDWHWGDLTSDTSLAFLCALARRQGTVLEFGTYRGRTTYNLALNAEHVWTVDLGDAGADADANSESRPYDRYVPGELFIHEPEVAPRVTQILGDSLQLDIRARVPDVGLVFIDGGHSYEVCRADTLNALRVVRPGGVVVWDDYGRFWPGVKRAVDEFAARETVHLLPRANLAVYVRDEAPV
jgi:predicted O-methyltransferase YrrM